jgi:hypothetical protein
MEVRPTKPTKGADMRESIGLTPAQAIEANFAITLNISRLLGWLVFCVAHLALAWLGLALLWWFQVTPEQIQNALPSGISSTASAAGLSVIGGLSGYLTVAQWAWRKLYVPWQTDQLMQGLGH